MDDNKKNPYLNSDHAGTPENFKPYVIGGQREAVALNYTGGLSGTAAVGPMSTVELKLKINGQVIGSAVFQLK